MFWVVGFSLLILEPTLILFAVKLIPVAVAYLVLWASALIFTVYVFRETQSWLRKSA